MFGVCFMFIYTISISIICVSQEELGTTSTSEQFFKRKDIVESKFLISVNCLVRYRSLLSSHDRGVNIYLYGCVSLLAPECAVYLCVYVCETHSKVLLVLKYQGSTFIDP